MPHLDQSMSQICMLQGIVGNTLMKMYIIINMLHFVILFRAFYAHLTHTCTYMYVNFMKVYSHLVRKSQCQMSRSISYAPIVAVLDLHATPITAALLQQAQML